jgi:hypothetical protein
MAVRCEVGPEAVKQASSKGQDSEGAGRQERAGQGVRSRGKGTRKREEGISKIKQL